MSEAGRKCGSSRATSSREGRRAYRKHDHGSIQPAATLSRAALKTTHSTFAQHTLFQTPSLPSNSIAVRERGNSSASLTYFERLNGLLLLVGASSTAIVRSRIVRIRARPFPTWLVEKGTEGGTEGGWGERLARFFSF